MKRSLRIIISLLFALIPVLLAISPNTLVSANSATPAAAVDCTGIAEYVRNLEQWYEQESALFDAMGLDFNGLNSMSPQQMAALAASFHTAADDLAKIDAPPIAELYHQRLVTEVHILANAIADMPSLGIMGALLFYFGSTSPEAGQMTADQWEAVLAQQCPDFASFLIRRDGNENPLTATPKPTPDQSVRRLSGSVRLTGAVDVLTPVPHASDGECAGSGPYSALSPNASAVIRDQDDRILGYGSLGDGHYEISETGVPTCTFQFFVSQVPVRETYSVEVADIGIFVFTFAELEQIGWVIQLTFG